jgi:hypothetical protein
MEEVVMTVRSCLLAGWLGCLGANIAAPLATAQDTVPTEPRKISLAPADNANQQLAEAVVGALQRNSQLKGYRIDVVVVGDVAELHGQVTDAGQRDLAQQTARSVPGVARVDERLKVGDIAVAALQDFVPNAPPQTGGPTSYPGAGPAFPPAPTQINSGGGRIMPIPNTVASPPATPVMHGGQPGMMPNPQYQPPPMPPYAWPTYAPYNNYSRVAQPKSYSYNQWPFIGPMYPYPKVPLGWRRVTLEWQDGNWWYGRESNGHDWWRVRYW